MPDILANTATTSSVGVTDVFAGMLNLANDPDWWRLSTTAGMTYTFPVNNGTGHDAAVADRNAAEAVVSRLVVDGDSLSLTATKAETYFLGVEDGGAMASAATLATAPSLNGAIGTALTSVIELTGTDAAEVLEGGMRTTSSTAVVARIRCMATAAMTPCSAAPKMTRSLAGTGSILRIILR